MMALIYNFNTMYYLTFFFVSGFVLVDYGMAFIDIQIQGILSDMESKKNEVIEKQKT